MQARLTYEGNKDTLADRCGRRIERSARLTLSQPRPSVELPATLRWPVSAARVSACRSTVC